MKAKLAFAIHLDIALWFQLACILAAFAKLVTHRDVMHAWVIVMLWTVLHHACRRATAWGSGYAASLILPSAALMPLEWCLPLRDTADGVGSFEDVCKWHAFIKERCGVDLT